MTSERVERNQVIKDMFAAGKTMQEIGFYYGISKQRVEQIIHKKPSRREIMLLSAKKNQMLREVRIMQIKKVREIASDLAEGIPIDIEMLREFNNLAESLKHKARRLNDDKEQS